VSRSWLGFLLGIAAFAILQTFGLVQTGRGFSGVALLGWVIAYLSLFVAEAVVASGGLPRLAAMVPLSYFVPPSVVAWFQGDVTRMGDTYLPGLASQEPLPEMPLLRLLLYVGCFLIPLAVRRSQKSLSRPRRRPSTSGLVVAAAGCLALVYVSSVLFRGPLPAGALMATGTTGILIAFMHVPVWRRAVAGFGTSGMAAYVIGLAMLQALPEDLSRGAALLALAGIPVVMGLATPVGLSMETVYRRPFVLLLALNSLNVLDAGLTMIEIRRGDSRELNPLVTTFGMGPKMLIVALASLGVYWFRPQWLKYPYVVFVCLVIYHLAGLAT
jgi:hypothetical protein